MTDPTLQSLLTRADVPDTAPTLTPDLAPALLATHTRRRRRTKRRLLTATATAAAFLLAAIPLTRDRTPPPHLALAPPPSSKSEISDLKSSPSSLHPSPFILHPPSPAALATQAAYHAALAEKLWSAERRATRVAHALATVPPIDPRPLAREQAAMALLSQADWAAAAEKDLAAARADYQRTIHLFPDTRAATLATARLQRLDRQELNRSDTTEPHTPGKDT